MTALVLRILSSVILIATAVTAQAASWQYSGSSGKSATEPMANTAPPQVAQAPAKTNNDVAVDAGMLLPPPAEPKPGMALPRSGIKLDKVRSEFGEPQLVLPAVGQPPILRWKYPEYVVYFEYDLVIISVPNQI
jgi:hypothetical protein